jgi:hypothetical protein
MSWNYRVLAHKDDDDVMLMIHEVYYDENGKPNSYTVNPVPVRGEDLDALKFSLEKMNEALTKPILWYGSDFPKEYEKL